MPRGGRRPGAGRKPGGRNQKSREVADRAAAQGITPLEVMLDAMRRHHKEKRYDDAAKVARDAAPYVHPRLAAVEVSGPDGGPVPVALEEMAAADRELEEWERQHGSQRNGHPATAGPP